MKRLCLSILIIFLACNCFASPGRLGLTLGSPYAGIKYSFSERINTEIRAGIDTVIKTNSIKFAYNLSKGTSFTPFLGIEYGLITFNDEGFKGTGSLLTALIGEEFSVSPRFSLALEMGYSNITLETEEFSVSGPEWIFNFGLNYYFIIME